MKVNRRCKQGAILVFVVLMLPALIGLTGFAIDLSQSYTLHARVKGAIDLAATAGLSKLSPDVQESFRISDAKTEALNYLNANLNNTIPGWVNLPLNHPNLTINVGRYDTASGLFSHDESNPNDVDAIYIDYSHTINTNFSTIFNLNSLTARAITTCAKVPSTYAPSGTVFPFGIHESTLGLLPGSNVKRLYISGPQQNLFLTSFMSDSADEADIISILDYFRGAGGAEPPKVEVDDTFRWNNSPTEWANIHNNYIFNNYYDDLDVVLPIIQLNGTSFSIKGFVGANIFDSGLGGMGYYTDVEFLPGYIDSNWKGTRVGTKTPTVDPTLLEYLVQSPVLVGS